MTVLRIIKAGFWTAFGLALWVGNRPVGAEAIALSLNLGNLDAPLAPLSIQIEAQPLTSQVFPGKDILMPVAIHTDRPPRSGEAISVEMLYQFVDTAGQSVTGLNSAPVAMASSPAATRGVTIGAPEPRAPGSQTYQGTVRIRRSTLPTQPGSRLQYYFRTTIGSNRMMLMRGPSGGSVNTSSATAEFAPFEAQYIDTWTQTVSNAGAVVSVPDTSQTDGKTGVMFPPGALSGPGRVTFRMENAQTVPVGPKNLKPVVVYDISLDGTSLQRYARVTLSYPANRDGTVAEENYSPSDLAMYTYQWPNGWQLLGRPQLDSTLNTITTDVTHFSLFALFPTGAVGAADLRPRQRILTPNGDGANDTVPFTGLTERDTVRLFDMRGRRIVELHGPPHVWDGRDDQGRIVESGVYLYQYTSDGERVSGVIMVAK